MPNEIYYTNSVSKYFCLERQGFCLNLKIQFIYLFLELKYKKYCHLLSYNYFIFTFNRKCPKIIVFSRRDGFKMNFWSIGLGIKITLWQYAIISLKTVLPIWSGCFNIRWKAKSMKKGLLLTRVLNHWPHQHLLPLWSYWKLVCLESGVSIGKLLPLIILKISLSGFWIFQY